MRYGPVVAVVVGAAFFGLLPVFAPPVVLQTEEIPVFLLGLGASMVAGAALFVAGGSMGRGLLMVATSALAGSVLYAFVHAVPTYGLSDGPGVLRSLIRVTLLYLGVPAAIGAGLAGAAASLLTRHRRRG